MKTSLSHLDKGKQEQIRHIVEIIKEEANPERIILFGSHARGNWVGNKIKSLNQADNSNA